MRLPEAPGSTSHLVEALPFVANRLLQLGAMKPVWCKDLAHRQNRLGYIINVTASGVSSDPNISDNCKTFYLQPIAQSNLLVLIISSSCPQNLTETCIPRAPVLPPLVPSSTGLRQCLRCVNGTSTMPTCQLLCQCPMASNLCPDSQMTLKDSSAICTGSQDLLSPYDIKPNPPSPAVSICPKTCSEVYTKIDCGNITDCVWDTSQTFPTCIHNVRQTTVATTTSTVSTTNTPLTTTSITTLTTTTLATSTSTASTTSSSTTTASTTTPTTTTTLASSTSAASTITTPTTTTLTTPTTTSVETTSTAPSHSLSAKIATNSTTAPITGSTETMVTAIPAAITTIGSSTLYLSKLFTTAPPSVPTTSSFTEFPTFVTAQPTIDSKPTGDVTESQTMSSPAISYLNASNSQTSIPEQYMTENNYKSSGKTDSSLSNIIIAASVAAVVCLMAAVAAVVYMKMVKRPNHVHDKSHNNGGRERSNYIIDDNDINHDYTYITPDRPRYVTVFNVAPRA
ncbi:mucin-5AC-like isoform X2 [Biomphalaria pfeifferi]|uniref:Mucin-5AC-like isoform X2 n=1 Tax=Biomphalaria pfeifferi TaxID=112525 RepID=A0AAD8C0K5_BIOPF|nr:mucin-5AC-like isoform X2 [Biomphalaria pfeifferi]